MFKSLQTIFLLFLFLYAGAFATENNYGYSVKRITADELENKIGSYALNGGWCVIPSIAMRLRGMSECQLFVERKCTFKKLTIKNRVETCYFILYDKNLRIGGQFVIYDVLKIITRTPYSLDDSLDIDCRSFEMLDVYTLGVGLWHWRKKNEGIGYGGYLKIKSAWAVDKDNKKFIELDPKKTSCELNEDRD